MPSPPTPPFQRPEVAAAYAEHPPEVEAGLLRLRQLVFEVAAETDGVGAIDEDLRWGQPAYLTTASGSGTTIRLDRVKGEPGRIGLYVHCRTSVIDELRQEHGDRFATEGTRAVHLDVDQSLPEPELRDLIRRALTYHQARRRTTR